MCIHNSKPYADFAPTVKITNTVLDSNTRVLHLITTSGNIPLQKASPEAVREYASQSLENFRKISWKCKLKEQCDWLKRNGIMEFQDNGQKRIIVNLMKQEKEAVKQKLAEIKSSHNQHKQADPAPVQAE